MFALCPAFSVPAADDGAIQKQRALAVCDPARGGVHYLCVQDLAVTARQKEAVWHQHGGTYMYNVPHIHGDVFLH